ncbi:sensor histidine kinase [Hyphomicrobium sp. MC8b]|uniref:sensor histidine kinase n=1 Tax=Hyphomicrobium sp. MC8b TaxID=300273 RepID=UPI00391A187B
MNNNLLQRFFRPHLARMLPHFLFPRAPSRLLAYALCLGILLPSLTFTAYLLTQLHARELSILHQSAQSRALLAASYFDERMASLVSSLKELASPPAEASESVYDHLKSELGRNGILVFNRAANLDLLSPTSGADAAIAALDAPARSAAAAALATLAPQITPYGMAAKGGVNIWIASTDKAAPPVVLQARIPSAYLTATLKNFVSDGPWSISIVGGDGQVYAEANGKPLKASYSEAADAPSLVEAFADTSQFGWKIAAGVPSRSIELHTRRNWMTFVAISSLLAIASFTGATLLTRSVIEESNSDLAQAPRMPSSIDRPSKTRSGLMSIPAADDRARAALKAGNVGVWEWDLRSGAIHWDAEIARIFGHAVNGDQLAHRLLRLVEPSDRRPLLSAISAALANMTPLAVEVRVRRLDGQGRWIALRGAATKIARGKISVLSGVAYDVTDLKVSLTRTDALLREVSHRSKNLLALILAMARLTARDAVDVKSHLKDFTLRVAGLSASQDLIVASDWQCVDLATLASAEIGAVARTDADRISVSGPPVSLTPEAAQSFGMVLTELALNAVEHGALSSAKGEVHLSWTFPDAETIEIIWHETGGPPFPVDGPTGYGRSVVERFSTQGLKLSVHAAAGIDGFKWTLTGPLANVGARGGREAGPSV